MAHFKFFKNLNKLIFYANSSRKVAVTLFHINFKQKILIATTLVCSTIFSVSFTIPHNFFSLYLLLIKSNKLEKSSPEIRFFVNWYILHFPLEFMLLKSIWQNIPIVCLPFNTTFGWLIKFSIHYQKTFYRLLSSNFVDLSFCSFFFSSFGF